MRIKTISKLAALLAVFAIGTVHAAPKEAPKTEAKPDAKAEAKGDAKGKAKRDTYPLYGEVVAVTAKVLTIKGGEGKEDRKYAITADTKIHDNAKPATIADIKVGKKVGGLIKKVEGSGDDQMVSINTGVKQERSAGDKKGEAAKPATEEPKSKGKKKAE